MGHHALFVIRKNGCDRYFRDRYAGQDVVSSLLYGLEGAIDLVEWGKEVENTGNPANDNSAEGGLLLDYDFKVLIFYGCQQFLDDTELIPYLVDLLKKTSWKGWDVRWAKWGMLSISKYLGFSREAICGNLEDFNREAKISWFDRWLEFDDQYTETTVTYKNTNKSILNYITSHNLEDTLPIGENIIKHLANRKESLLPYEKNINNCLHIDEPNKTIHIFWGYPLIDNCLLMMLDFYWSGWQVKWIDEGYAGHLKLIGYKQDDLLIGKEEAMNGVIEIFKEPIKRSLTRVKQENQPDRAEAIVHWEKQLEFLEKLKQEWLRKVK